MINNKAIFFRGIFKRLLGDSTFDTLLKNLKLFVKETAFLIRTFFFFFFGLSIAPEAFLNLSTYYIAGIMLISLYIIRYYSLKTIVKSHQIFPELFIAPRGLITILLLFSIPEHLLMDQFEGDLTFMVIIGSNIIMMIALIGGKTGIEDIAETRDELWDESDLNENEKRIENE